MSKAGTAKFSLAINFNELTGKMHTQGIRQTYILKMFQLCQLNTFKDNVFFKKS